MYLLPLFKWNDLKTLKWQSGHLFWDKNVQNRSMVKLSTAKVFVHTLSRFLQCLSTIGNLSFLTIGNLSFLTCLYVFLVCAGTIGNLSFLTIGNLSFLTCLYVFLVCAGVCVNVWCVWLLCCSRVWRVGVTFFDVFLVFWWCNNFQAFLLSVAPPPSLLLLFSF